MAFKFYIDGQLTDQPDNDTQLTTTIRRDDDLKGFFTTQDVTLVYSANNAPASGTVSGYTLLKTAFDLGTCNELEMEVRDEISGMVTNRIYTGVIKVPSMIFDEQKMQVKCKIDDNSFYSYIKNNQNVQFNLYATKTKNGQPITPPQVWRVDMFQSEPFQQLSGIGNYYYGYRVYDVLKFIVPAISDNKVTFESEFLTTMPGEPLLTPDDPIELFIFDGYALSHPNTSPAIVISFAQLVKELNKLKNTYFYIDSSDPDAPVLRLEHQSWFYNGATVLSFDEPETITSYIDTKKLYGTIKTGADYNPGGAASVYTWQIGTSYFGWDEEVYTPYGQCNFDTELNLVNDIYITSNSVNDQVNGAVDSNMDKMFIVECDELDTVNFVADAVDWTNYSPDPVQERYYNLGLNNVHKIQIHGGNFQSAVTNTQDAGTDIFRASMGQDNTIMDQTPGSGLVSTFTASVTTEPVPFPDELGGDNYDPGGNYNNVSYYYTAPADGDYSFATLLTLEFENIKNCVTPLNTAISQANIQTQFGALVTIQINVYEDNTFANLIDNQSLTFQQDQNGIFDYNLGLVTQLDTGNVVRVSVASRIIVMFPQFFGSTPLSTAVIAGGICGYTAGEPKMRVTARTDSVFECNGTPDGGIILAQPDLALFRSKVHEFSYDISASDFLEIEALPIGLFNFTKDSVTRSGWIEQIIYNNWTGRAQIKLITSDAAT